MIIKKMEKENEVSAHEGLGTLPNALKELWLEIGGSCHLRCYYCFANSKGIDNYIDNDTYIKFKCLVNGCNHIWSAIPGNLLYTKRKCGKCTRRFPLNKDYVRQKLLDKNINLLSNYINTQKKTDFDCIICSYKWSTAVSNILSKKNSGCPNCNRPGMNEKIIHKILKNNNIKYNGNYYIRHINKTCNRNFSVDFYFSDIKLLGSLVSPTEIHCSVIGLLIIPIIPR